MEVQQIAFLCCDVAWIKVKAAVGNADVPRCCKDGCLQRSQKEELNSEHIDDGIRAKLERYQ